MSKFFISILYLFIASTSMAAEGITIGNVAIKIPKKCNVSRDIQNNLNCKNNPQDEEFYIALRKGDTFESHVLNSTREKTIFKIENDYFARVIVDKRPFYFMYIKNCNIIIHGGDVSFIFSMAIDIKHDNKSCR